MRRGPQRGSFLPTAALIIVAGVLVLGMMIGFVAWGQSTTTDPSTTTTAATNYNTVGSYGNTGYEQLTIRPTAETPAFVADALKTGRGVVILAYVQGATDDDEMLANFETVKSQYEGVSDFFSFEAAEVSQFGDLLKQLGVDAPPVFAVIKPDGSVYQLYTGWISQQVMDQVVSNATKL